MQRRPYSDRRPLAAVHLAIIAWLTVCPPASASDASLPRVLIIGDSISVGYTPYTQELLADQARVERIPGNAAHTWNGLAKLDTWLGHQKWDVIHFNWGLHDLKHLNNGKLDQAGTRISTDREYEKNLVQLVRKLKATGAQLIWASTTPIPDGAQGRIHGQEILFNTIARKTMDANGVRVDDLHAWVRPFLARYQQPKNVHFTKEGSRFLADKVARSILNALEEPVPPFAMPDVKPPVFPDRTFDIRDYGARPRGRALNTQAIQRAITACHQSGGGCVLIPAGTWHTGGIQLASNVNLHLAADAELLFSTNPEHYLPPLYVRWAGMECHNLAPLIYADHADNIAITGRGTLNGQGQPWWAWTEHQDRVARKLYQMALDNVPVNNRVFSYRQDPLRPQFFQPIHCTNVYLEGVTFTSGPFWTVQFVYCQNVLARNVIIEHCTFATADDSVALKSGLNEDGWRVGRPSENVIVRHCRMKRGHGGVVIGSDMSGSVRNVFVHDCDFAGSDIGIRMKSARGRGGVVENVWYQDIELGAIKYQAVTIHTDYRAWFGSDQGKPPLFRNIHIRNVSCGSAAQAVRIVGLPEQAIENITFRNVAIVAERGMTCTDAREIHLTNVGIVPADGPTVTLANTRNVRIEDCPCPADTSAFLRVEGDRSGHITLEDVDLANLPTPILFDQGARPDMVSRN